jgi:hypothetical protein
LRAKSRDPSLSLGNAKRWKRGGLTRLPKSACYHRIDHSVPRPPLFIDDWLPIDSVNLFVGPFYQLRHNLRRVGQKVMAGFECNEKKLRDPEVVEEMALHNARRHASPYLRATQRFTFK